MFKECLKKNIIPFIIEDKKKSFYYRGLSKYKEERGFLVDTCLSMQDKYKKKISKYLKSGYDVEKILGE
jgi:pyoverdine/dityrosine biosynthesis protein Dit1